MTPLDGVFVPGDEVDAVRVARASRTPTGGSPIRSRGGCWSPSSRASSSRGAVHLGFGRPLPSGPPLFVARSPPVHSRAGSRPSGPVIVSATPTTTTREEPRAPTRAPPRTPSRAPARAALRPVARGRRLRRRRRHQPSDTTTEGSAATTGPAAGEVEGEIFITGSSTVEPISVAVAEGFEAVQPDVTVDVEGPGTGDGMKLFCGGEADITGASRAIKEEEVTACADAGVEFLELKVANDGLTVMTNPANATVECLSKEDLYALTGPESEGFANWQRRPAARHRARLHDRVPRRPARHRRPGRGVGHLRRFHRAGPRRRGEHPGRRREDHRGPGGDDPARLPVLARGQHDHPGRRGQRRRLRLGRASLSPRTPARGSRRSRSTGATGAWLPPPTPSPTTATRCPGRCSSTSTTRP